MKPEPEIAEEQEVKFYDPPPLWAIDNLRKGAKLVA
jgi:hypothetical protein